MNQRSTLIRTIIVLLQEDCTRHQFYLQIRRDIYSGKLNCPLSTQYLLSSYIVQGKNHTNFQLKINRKSFILIPL